MPFTFKIKSAIQLTVKVRFKVVVIGYKNGTVVRNRGEIETCKIQFNCVYTCAASPAAQEAKQQGAADEIHFGHHQLAVGCRLMPIKCHT